MSDIERSIYGDAFVNAKEKFITGLLDIEKKHISWFEGRESKLEKEKHDRLHHHYLLKYDGNSINISIIGNELPEHIANECLDCLKSNFETNS